MFVRNHKAGGSRTRSQVPASPSTRPAPALHLFPPPSCHLRIQSLPTRAGRRLPVLPELRHPSPLTPQGASGFHSLAQPSCFPLSPGHILLLLRSSGSPQQRPPPAAEVGGRGRPVDSAAQGRGLGTPMMDAQVRCRACPLRACVLVWHPCSGSRSPIQPGQGLQRGICCRNKAYLKCRTHSCVS